MTDDEIITKARELLEAARQTYAEDGEVYSIFYIITSERLIAFVPWGISKEMAADVIRHQCKVHKARGLLHIMEAWTVLGMDLPDDMRPSEHPNAQSHIVGILQDSRIGLRVWMSLAHSDDGRYWTDPIEEPKNPETGEVTDTVTGLFANMLPMQEFAS